MHTRPTSPETVQTQNLISQSDLMHTDTDTDTDTDTETETYSPAVTGGIIKKNHQHTCGGNKCALNLSFFFHKKESPPGYQTNKNKM